MAIGSDDQVIGRVQLARPAHHAEHLAPAIAYLLDQLDLSLDQVSAIGVGIGPGLFTGLRVGVTTAKVMAQSLRIPLIAVPSLDLLAFEVRYTDRLVVPALDAKRGEVFYSTYRQVPGGVQRLTPYRISGPHELASELLARSEDSLAVGDGALRYRDVLGDIGGVDVGEIGFAYPSASALVELAHPRAIREEFVQPWELELLYLRKSDAEIKRAE